MLLLGTSLLNYFLFSLYYCIIFFFFFFFSSRRRHTRCLSDWSSDVCSSDLCDTLSAAGITPITIGTKDVWPAAAWFDYIDMRLNGPEFHISLMDLKEIGRASCRERV